MPLKLDIKRYHTTRSDRVKAVDIHPTEPWILCALYNGRVNVWNFDSNQSVKSFEVCDLPVRAAIFVPRKNWIITGSDDMHMRVYNYNTLERQHMFEAHSDYLRCLACHPVQPYILSSSDDMSIKCWDWEKKWTCVQVFEGHSHYVMQIVINPKDNNTFASGSLDRTVKVWQFGSSTANFTLEGHEKGVNCVDYYHGGDKPYLISGADDRVAKIWDYQNKTCVQTLEGHAQNVSAVRFHPGLPVIITGSEDGTIRLWHSSTYRLETTLNYGMERVWAVNVLSGSNHIVVAYDDGSVLLKLGREQPAMSMDQSGKIVWAKSSDIQQANLKAMADTEIKDGEKLALMVKDLGTCEVYPQTIQHNPNGRFLVVCGDGEFIIYTAMALRNKAFGSGQEFVWGIDPSEYAVRESNSNIKIFKNFKERKSFKPDLGAEGIYGGQLLGVRAASSLSFFNWETLKLIRRIDIAVRHIFWSDSGEFVTVTTDDSFHILRYKSEAIKDGEQGCEGYEAAFDVVGEVEEIVKTGLWVGDCFIYTNSVNRLNYYVGGEIVTIAHLDRTLYLLGYIPKDNRLYLGDKDLNIVSVCLLLSVLEYQTAVMRHDFDTADRVLTTIPREHRTRVAHFLEKQGFKQQALAVTMDSEHKFELALQLNQLSVAYQLAKESHSEHKWKQLAELAISSCQFKLAQECFTHAQDYGGLLLLASCCGDINMLTTLADDSEKIGENNVAFTANLLAGRMDRCLDVLIKSDRIPEAGFFARTYCPSQVSRIVGLWKDTLALTNEKTSNSLADPEQYENLFPNFQQNLLLEQFSKQLPQIPASSYPQQTLLADRNLLAEMKASGTEIVMPSALAPPQDPELTPTTGTAAEEPADQVEEPPLVTEQQQAKSLSKQDDDEFDLDMEIDNLNLDDVDDENLFSDDDDDDD